MTELLNVENLSLKIPLASGTLNPVREVNISLERGQTLGIVGESGSGKSLTALALMGLTPQKATRTAAGMRLGDQDLLKLDEYGMAKKVRGKRMAMIFQEPMTSLNPVYTIGRQMMEVMHLHLGAGQDEAQKRAIFLLEKVGITAAASRLGQYPHQLSGGLRQRVMIAMALMCQPEIIIADEPTTALDVTIQAQILSLLKSLQAEFGMALILITHDLGIISRMADKVSVMYAGRIMESGACREVLETPKHPYTKGLLNCIPDPARIRSGMHLGAIAGFVPSLLGQKPGCEFAPRCPWAKEECGHGLIKELDLGHGRKVRCLDPSLENWPLNSSQPKEGAPAKASQKKELLRAGDVYCHFKITRGIFHRRQTLKAVDGVGIKLYKGQVSALVGESGCGKSTLANVLLGLQEYQSGQVEIDGVSVSKLPTRTRAAKIQPIFQDPYSSLNPRRTVGAIIQRPLDVHALGTLASRRKKVEGLMERVGLPSRLMHSFPNQMSGGQRQRVAIARALILQPEIIICDEPTSALDVSVQSQILNLLLDLQKEFGLSYLLITHDLSIVQHMASQVAVMYLGRVVEQGPAKEIFNNPKHPYTKALLHAALSIDCRAGIPETGLGDTYPNPIDPPDGCTFHPRCPKVMEICRVEPPKLVEESGRSVSCHLFEKNRGENRPKLMAG